MSENKYSPDQTLSAVVRKYLKKDNFKSDKVTTATKTALLHYFTVYYDCHYNFCI